MENLVGVALYPVPYSKVKATALWVGLQAQLLSACDIRLPNTTLLSGVKGPA